MLVTPIDLAFVAVGLAVTVWGLRRRWTVPPLDPPPAASLGEPVLTALALVPAAVGPNVLVVALTPGMPGMPILVGWALVPSILLLIAVWMVAYARRHGRLTNRIWTGLWVGAAATAALDFFRLQSFLLGWLPGNLPRMFGVLIMDTMATGPTPLSDVVGGLYHYWVSACFGLTYALIMGRTRWWGGLIWGLIIEVGMMTTPPMVVAMDTGYFGLKLGRGLLNGIFIGSLIPHISYGIALGLLLERYLRHEGTLFTVLCDALSPVPAPSPSRSAPARTGRGWSRWPPGIAFVRVRHGSGGRINRASRLLTIWVGEFAIGWLGKGRPLKRSPVWSAWRSRRIGWLGMIALAAGLVALFVLWDLSPRGRWRWTGAASSPTCRWWRGPEEDDEVEDHAVGIFREPEV